MSIFEKYWYFIIPAVIILLFCVCFCLACACKHVYFSEQQVDVENGINFQENYPLREITPTRYNTTRAYIEYDSSKTEEESQEAILRQQKHELSSVLHEPKRWHGVNYASVDLSRTDTFTLHKETRNKKKQAIF